MIYTNEKTNLTSFPLLFAYGRRSTSLPYLKSINVGNCLLVLASLIWYFAAASGYLPTSTLPNLKFSNAYLEIIL